MTKGEVFEPVPAKTPAEGVMRTKLILEVAFMQEHFGRTDLTIGDFDQWETEGYAAKLESALHDKDIAPLLDQGDFEAVKAKIREKLFPKSQAA